MFGNRKKQNDEVPLPPQEKGIGIIDPRKIVRDTIFAFAYNWDTPPDIKNLHPVYMSFDAATTDLTDREIESRRLKMSALSDIQIATMFRPSDFDKFGIQILSKYMQSEDAGFFRMKKSRNGKLLQLSVSVHQIHEHRYSNNEERGRIL